MSVRVREWSAVIGFIVVVGVALALAFPASGVASAARPDAAAALVAPAGNAAAAWLFAEPTEEPQEERSTDEVAVRLAIVFACMVTLSAVSLGASLAIRRRIDAISPDQD